MVINAYRALTKDEKIVICNATSMENALKLLSVDYNEPSSLCPYEIPFLLPIYFSFFKSTLLTHLYSF